MVVEPQGQTQLGAEFAGALKLSPMHEVGLQRMEERLHVRVLAWCAAARHALMDAEGDQALPKRRPEILTAAIAVKDQPGPWPAAAACRVDDGARGPEPPGQKPTGILIQHGGKVPPAAGDRQIREGRT